MVSDETLGLITKLDKDFPQKEPMEIAKAEIAIELKQHRESDLRPAVKFLGQDFGQLIGKVCSECDEVIEAWDDDFDQCPEQLPKEVYNDILMELVDIQMACETALTKILPDRADRDEVRRQVIEKNRRRGYYEGGGQQ